MALITVRLAAADVAIRHRPVEGSQERQKGPEEEILKHFFQTIDLEKIADLKH
jgi:hypothetical protein